jgi:hypothetical protein
MAEEWTPGPGEPVVLSLGGSRADAIIVHITPRVVAPARDGALQRLLWTPSAWASALALLAMFAVIGTAFATGTIRPAPPAAAAPRPGEATPTPDTRPRLAIGGLVLQPPVAAPPPPATPIPADAAAPDANAGAAATEVVTTDAPDVATAEGSSPDHTDAAPDDGAAIAGCSNILGIGCPPRRPSTPVPLVIRPQPAARPPLTHPTAAASQASQGDAPPASDASAPESSHADAPQTSEPDPVPPSGDAPAPLVVPAASPAARSDPELPDLAGPSPGSDLDRALHIASLANDRFNRSLTDPANATPVPADDTRGHSER